VELSRGQWAREASDDTIWALHDVSFELRAGEIVGIIGRNGAGKSTLLKILSRIAEPTAGRVLLCGRVGSLLEVGTGFHPELTGRENIFLNGAILGMSRRQIARQFDAIVAFAEIDELIDTPVKRYSSGMYVRLAFAVAAHMDPDILLIDEVLAVGDLAFQRKCLEHTARIRERAGTVLLVSHNMFAIKAICGRAIYLSRGQMILDGAPEKAIQLYEKDSRLATAPWAQTRIGSDPSQRPIEILDIDIMDEAGESRTYFEHGERMRIRIHYDAKQAVPDANFVLSFIRSDNVACCNHNTAMDGFEVGSISGRGCIELLTAPLRLVSELYTLHVLVWDTGFHKLYCAQVGDNIQVSHPVLSTHFGVFHEPGEWSFPAVPEVTL
jgi:lipopolysaccharide transport system ATP-binding protein